jgi:hypothetical protein
MEGGRHSPKAQGPVSAVSLKGKLQELEAKPKIVVSELNKTAGLSQEYMVQGSISGQIYKEYIKHCSVVAVTIFAIASLAQQGLKVACQFVLRSWSEYNQAKGYNAASGHYLGIYAGLGAVQVVLCMVGTLLLTVLCILRSARIMHDKVCRLDPGENGVSFRAG